MNASPFLKRVLLLDATSCLMMGALLLFGSESLSQLFSLPAVLLFYAGALLVPIGLFMAWVATRPVMSAGLVSLIIAGNALWVAESMVMATTTAGVSAAGQAFLAVQAAGISILTILELFGAVKLRAARV